MNQIMQRKFLLPLNVILFLISGCVVQVDTPTKSLSQSALIVTPSSHYSTPKARYLGERYRGNLERLVENIIRDPKTTSLQFANNIASSGGMGFFTHSAVKVADERFLEVVLGTPEIFEAKVEYSAKVARLFSLYGKELLRILASEIEIFEDKELEGYGLNFTWRTVLSNASGSRLGTERAIIYFAKDKVRSFLQESLSENSLLAEAVTFAVGQEGPAKLVSFRPQKLRPDFRPPIQEQVISSKPSEPNSDVDPAVTLSAADLKTRKNESNVAEEIAVRKNEDLAVTNGELASDLRDSDATSPKPKQLSHTAEPAPETEELKKGESRAKEKTVDSVTVKQTQAYQADLAESGLSKSDETAVRPAAMAKAPQKDQEPQKSVNSGSKVKTADPLLPQKSLSLTNPSLRQLEGKEEDIFKPDAKALEPSAVSLSTPLSETEKSVLRGEKAAATETPEMLPAHGVVQDTPEIAPAVPNTDSTPISGNRAPMVVSSARPQGLEQKASKEELALVREKLSKISPERRSPLGAAPKALEGYIIQLAFTDRSEARRWADTFQQRGYAVSMTEAASGSLRVRFGNFHVRDQAEQQLQNLKQDGLTGIIVNLPQAYQPEPRSLLP